LERRGAGGLYLAILIPTASHATPMQKVRQKPQRMFSETERLTALRNWRPNSSVAFASCGKFAGCLVSRTSALMATDPSLTSESATSPTAFTARWDTMYSAGVTRKVRRIINEPTTMQNHLVMGISSGYCRGGSRMQSGPGGPERWAGGTGSTLERASGAGTTARTRRVHRD
jgi:hypothetical protein